MIMVTIEISMTHEEYDKLKRLAQFRSNTKHEFSVEECIRDFIRTAQIGGTRWKNPAGPSVKKAKRHG